MSKYKTCFPHKKSFIASEYNITLPQKPFISDKDEKLFLNYTKYCYCPPLMELWVHEFQQPTQCKRSVCLFANITV